MSPTALLVAALAVGLGHLVKGLTGFGSALIAIPLVTLVLGPAQAIVLTTTVDVIVGGGLAIGALRDVPWRAAGVLLLLMLPLQRVGTLLHGSLPVDVVTRAIGVAVVLVACWALWRSLRPGGSEERQALGARAYTEAAGAAALGGVLSGLVGMPGPPIVAWTLRWLPPVPARALLLTVFVPTSVSLVAGYVADGLVEPSFVVQGLLVLPASVLGAWSGARLARVVSPEVFLRIVAALLLVAGSGMVLR